MKTQSNVKTQPNQKRKKENQNPETQTYATLSLDDQLDSFADLLIDLYLQTEQNEPTHETA